MDYAGFTMKRPRLFGLIPEVVSRLEKHYNRDVKVENWHSWHMNVTQAFEVQHRLASRVLKNGEVIAPRFIAGVDISVGKVSGVARGAVVVLSYPDLKVVETRIAEGALNFPYVPGLLSFREAPLAIAACERLTITPDLFLIDGQGVAHPRRFGLASHLGLFLNKPTIGCAKSLLCGHYEEPATKAGSYAAIVDKDETIGVVLRTKPGTKPVYVSIGYKVDLTTAIYWVMQCCRGYRLPEPLRLAHLAASGNIEPTVDAVPEAIH
jgi:deoxyribonuclease V